MKNQQARICHVRRLFTLAMSGAVLLMFCQCSTVSNTKATRVMISVKDQKLALYKQGKLVRKYPVSTSKFGEGDQPGSYRTPLGTMKVAEKIGGDAPRGAVFKSRRRTGEILKPNAPGRDPIVSRIIWLAGTEKRNKHAYKRFIYIHGTAEEKKIGQMASYGCIRMRSRDVIHLYKKIGKGTEVEVVRGSLPNSLIQATLAPAVAAAAVIGGSANLAKADRVPTHPALQKGRHMPAMVLTTNGGSSWSTPASGYGR